jgi:hypothetical protein
MRGFQEDFGRESVGAGVVFFFDSLMNARGFRGQQVPPWRFAPRRNEKDLGVRDKCSAVGVSSALLRLGGMGEALIATWSIAK